MPVSPIVLFDVMDTLVYNPFNNEIPAFFGLSHQELAKQTNASVWEAFERGQIDEATYFATCFHDRRAIDHAAFLSQVGRAYRWLDDDTVVLLDELREKVRALHAFSNYPIWYEEIEQRLNVSRWVPWSFVSCRTGHRKPTTAAFEQVLCHLRCSVEALLLIDDSYANCQAAWAIGMNAIHFTDTPTLRRQLIRMGAL